jgi:hypothetical protein
MAGEQVRELLERLRLDAVADIATDRLRRDAVADMATDRLRLDAVAEAAADAAPDPPVEDVPAAAAAADGPAAPAPFLSITETIVPALHDFLRQCHPFTLVLTSVLATCLVFTLFPRIAYGLSSLLFLALLKDSIQEYNSKIAPLSMEKKLPFLGFLSALVFIQILAIREAYGI